MKKGIYTSIGFVILFTTFSTFLSAEPVIGKRTIYFVNECPFPVWFGTISGATPSRAGGEMPCVTDADCYSGSVCIDRGAAPKHCFWKNPVPSNGNFKLDPNGGKNFIDFPVYDDILSALWSGAGTARLNCTADKCETGDCGGGDKGCPAGRGFMQPTTLAEWTFNKTGSDFYDISLVNGMSIPISMGPTVTLSNKGELDRYETAQDPYRCGNPGAVNPFTAVGKCSWDMSPPSNDYRWVRKGGVACVSDANCSNGEQCGLSYDPTKSPKLQKVCGKLLGYWVAHEACGKERNYGAPFNCTNPLPPPDKKLTLFDLYGCRGIGSCYQKEAKSNCCGCANWDKEGVDVPPAPLTAQCVNSNAFWKSTVLPTLKWVKEACPTVYTYPYDDMSSTFVCKIADPVSTNGNLNSANYTITFCPGGKTAGIN